MNQELGLYAAKAKYSLLSFTRDLLLLEYVLALAIWLRLWGLTSQSNYGYE